MIIEVRLPGGEMLALEFDRAPTPEEVQRRVAAHVGSDLAGAAQVSVPPGYTQDRWEDMPEERSDFFATRRRQPRVVSRAGTYAAGVRPPRRPGG
jgi:hypothetical protein